MHLYQNDTHLQYIATLYQKRKEIEMITISETALKNFLISVSFIRFNTNATYQRKFSMLLEEVISLLSSYDDAALALEEYHLTNGD